MSKAPRRTPGSASRTKPRRDKLFHVVVVLGSALVAGGACGKSTHRAGRHGGAGAGRDPGGSAGAGGVLSTAGMSGTGGISIDPPTGGSAGSSVTGGSGGVPPECEPASGGEMQAGGAPNSADDCANSAQFVCTNYEPAPMDCFCDPVAPPAGECCTGDTRFICAGGYDPPIGCRCDLISIITR